MLLTCKGEHIEFLFILDSIVCIHLEIDADVILKMPLHLCGPILCCQPDLYEAIHATSMQGLES